MLSQAASIKPNTKRAVTYAKKYLIESIPLALQRTFEKSRRITPRASQTKIIDCQDPDGDPNGRFDRQSSVPAILWFRQNLRTCDNPALAAAAAGGPVVPVYFRDKTAHSANRELGGASKRWLHHSLASLRAALGGLNLFRGPALDILPDLIGRIKATAVFWNRCYDPFSMARDGEIKTALREGGIETRSFNGALLHEPWQVSTRSGGRFKVFTPFWNSLLQHAVELPTPAPSVSCVSSDASLALQELDLLPARPNWAKDWEEQWTPGDLGARAVLASFVRDKLHVYHECRDRPAAEETSRLSPHLHFGEISPRQVWATVQHHAHEARQRKAALKFLSELGWRAPATVLAKAGVELGRTYPSPLIDHDAGRRAALEAYELVKAKRADSNGCRDAVS
jgi:deoxyribodipyrimidine photolyase